jgi:hypothetical protein
VLRGVSDQCGPRYELQTAPATCEWFIHDFPDGLPEGRFAIWAMWEAPCSAWIELGLTETCTDPHEVISLFSSGFDAPFSALGPDFDELSDARLSPNELIERYETFGAFDEPIGFIDPATIGSDEVTPSGDPWTAPLDDGDPALDENTPRLALGAHTESPADVRTDLLNTRCWNHCFRDAVIVDPDNEQMAIDVWAADVPFHIRHGFVNETTDPFGDDYDVVVSITRRQAPSWPKESIRSVTPTDSSPTTSFAVPRPGVDPATGTRPSRQRVSGSFTTSPTVCPPAATTSGSSGTHRLGLAGPRTHRQM